MLKTLTRDITLAIQTKSGASSAAIAWLCVVAVAALTAFVFLCVAGYDWLALRYGSTTAGLLMAAIFIVVAVIAAIISALIRRRVRERAILARAAKAHSPSWLLDPRVLSAAVQAGRSFGWQRIIPLALVGILATQWARERRDQNNEPL